MHATRYPVLEMDADISIHLRSGTGPPGPPATPSRDISISGSLRKARSRDKIFRFCPGPPGQNSCPGIGNASGRIHGGDKANKHHHGWPLPHHHCNALWIIGLPLWPSLSSAFVGNKHWIIACEQKEQGATVERFSHRRIAMVPLTSDQRRVSSWLNCRWAVSKDCQLSTTDFVRHNANAGTVTRPVVQLMTLIQASTSLTCEAVLGLDRST